MVSVVELRYLDTALATVRELQEDPTRERLFTAVIAALRIVRSTPGSAEARREAWQSDEWGTIWAVPLRTRHEDWLVLWTRQTDELGIVIYVGPQL